MISAKQAWKMATSTKYDERMYNEIMNRVESKIEDAVDHGDTCTHIELCAYRIPSERLYATYIKVLKTLRKRKYKASIQKEEHYDNSRYNVAAIDENNKWVVRKIMTGTLGTYLYVSWERK